MAKEDRARYEEERRTYRGPWKVAVSKKPYKDPNAPKRPMSAFLMYSNGRRAAVKKENPDFSNGEISRLLSEMWRKASDEDRQKYIKEEFELRTKYKEDMAKWKKEAEEKEKERAAKQAEEELNNPPPHREALAGLSNYSAMLASNPAAATSYLAAMAGGAGSGASQFEELAMQRARSQLEAEQRARMLAQLGGAGMDAGADMYSRYAVAAAAAGGGYPSAGGFGQYPDMLGAGKSFFVRGVTVWLICFSLLASLSLSTINSLRPICPSASSRTRTSPATTVACSPRTRSSSNHGHVCSTTTTTATRVFLWWWTRSAIGSCHARSLRSPI